MPAEIAPAVADGLLAALDFLKTPLGTALLAPFGSFAAGLLAVWITTRTTRRTNQERIEADGRLAERKFEFDAQLANRKFGLDARQADRKRRQDLAEEVLAGFYEVRSIISAVRSPAAFSDEGVDRPNDGNEPDDLRRARNSYYVPIARLLQHRDATSALLSRRFRMVAWFGQDAEQPFLRVNEVLNSISWAANALIHHVGADRHPESWARWENLIWTGVEEHDPLRSDVDLAVAEIEAICRPILAEPSLEYADREHKAARPYCLDAGIPACLRKGLPPLRIPALAGSRVS